jgi:hypothetical protein
MNDLTNFIKAWEESGDIAAVLEKGLALPPVDKMQSYLASLPQADHDKIRQSLTNAMIALEEYSAGLLEELASTKAQIDQNVKNTKASLSYMSADKIRKE